MNVRPARTAECAQKQMSEMKCKWTERERERKWFRWAKQDDEVKVRNMEDVASVFHPPSSILHLRPDTEACGGEAAADGGSWSPSSNQICVVEEHHRVLAVPSLSTHHREHRLFLAFVQMTNAATLYYESAENRCREVTQLHSEEVTHLIHESYL